MNKLTVDSKMLYTIKSTAVASISEPNKFEPQEQVTIAWLKAVVNALNKQLKLDIQVDLGQELDMDSIEEYTNL